MLILKELPVNYKRYKLLVKQSAVPLTAEIHLNFIEILTDNLLIYKMDYSILILSICIG